MQGELKRINTAEAVVNYIRDQIKGGLLRPGEALPSERDLQKQLGISRFSLREGLARLSALGVIEVIHGKGSYVAQEINGSSLAGVLTPIFTAHNWKVLEDLYGARSMLESETTRLAAMCRTDEDLERLRKILDMSEKVLDSVEACGRMDLEFHHEIAVIASNILLLKMHEAISREAQAFLHELNREQEHCRQAFVGHCEIFKCIKIREPQNAVEAMRAHLVTCKENYKSHFPDYPLMDSMVSQG